MAPKNDVDAQELPEALTQPTRHEGGKLQPRCQEQCTALNCRPGCALEIIAQLLAEPEAITAEDADSLLDLYYLLSRREDAEGVLRLFCALRPRLESRHYLLFYRLRRWLQNQVRAAIRARPGAAPVIQQVNLRGYCVQALRRACLCAAMPQADGLDKPVLRFVFVPGTTPLAISPATHRVRSPAA